MDDAFIYDFETLSQNPIDGVVVSVAFLNFSFYKLEKNAYDYDTLLNNTLFLKFDVEEQVKLYDRKIEESTLDWWKQQDKEAVKKLRPLDTDISISRLGPLFDASIKNKQNVKTFFTRNNTFDPVILYSITKYFNQPMPHDWWKIRDTKSFIDGLTYGSDIRDNFIPPGAENKYVKHDPRHDIVLDVLRLQTLLYHKFGE